jgi:hypothetical protein
VLGGATMAPPSQASGEPERTIGSMIEPTGSGAQKR